jgi:alkylation response protein AidB-like acyl-CoA dehydrogenase
VQTTAEDDGDFWIVSGEKMFITNGPIADFLVVLVRTRPEPTMTSFTLLIVPADTPGFRVKATLKKLGLHTSPTGWLVFDRCRVPKRHTLGKPHLGFFYAGTRLLEERLIAGACGVATASLVLEETLQHVRTRRLYDQPLGAMQAVRHRLAEVAAEIEMARRFVHSVAEEYRDGHVDTKAICMVKFQVVEVVQRAVERCLQLHGGAGFLEESWVARVYRDMRVLSVGGGASEMMKDVVAGHLRI